MATTLPRLPTTSCVEPVKQEYEDLRRDLSEDLLIQVEEETHRKPAQNAKVASSTCEEDNQKKRRDRKLWTSRDIKTELMLN